jgi:hypothetical protein
MARPVKELEPQEFPFCIEDAYAEKLTYPMLELPSDEDIRSLRKHSYVKLLFETKQPIYPELKHERMLVKIVEADYPNFIGKIDSRARTYRGYYTMLFRFEARHIFDIYREANPNFEVAKTSREEYESSNTK